MGLEKSFPMMYSNIGLNSQETVPLKAESNIFLKLIIDFDSFLIESHATVPLNIRSLYLEA